MYRQFDGYPSGHGAELQEFLSGFTIVNGLSRVENRRVANGAGCLAAQAVEHFKNGPGGVYLTAPRLALDWEDYGYLVIVDESAHVHVKCYTGDPDNVEDIVFSGTVAEFGGFCAKEAA
jgi:hypothetical protein